MDDDTQLKLSLDDLLRIALGTDSPSGVNTIVLHSLLDLVLQKLGCENEKISISGYDAKVIEGLLQTSTISPLVFNTEKIETIKKFNCLKELESTVGNLEQGLEFHLEKLFSRISLSVIRSSLHSLVPIHQFCENICSGGNPDMEKACAFTADEPFNERVLQQILPPLVTRFQAMTKKFETFEAEFVEWLEGMENHLEKICLAEKRLKDIEGVGESLTKYCNTFLAAMEEVQDMMDTKVDRFQILLLRDAIENRIANIKNDLSDLLGKRKQPLAAAIIFDPNTVVPQKPDRMTIEKHQAMKCGCAGIYQQASVERPLLLRLMNMQMPEEMESKGVRRKSRSLSISLRTSFGEP